MNDKLFDTVFAYHWALHIIIGGVLFGWFENWWGFYMIMFGTFNLVYCFDYLRIKHEKGVAVFNQEDDK